MTAKQLKPLIDKLCAEGKGDIEIEAVYTGRIGATRHSAREFTPGDALTVHNARFDAPLEHEGGEEVLLLEVR